MASGAIRATRCTVTIGATKAEPPASKRRQPQLHAPLFVSSAHPTPNAHDWSANLLVQLTPGLTDPRAASCSGSSGRSCLTRAITAPLLAARSAH